MKKITTKIDTFLKDMDINCPLMNQYIQCNSNQNPDKDLMKADKPAVKFISNSEGPRIANRLKEECGLNLFQYKRRSEEQKEEITYMYVHMGSMYIKKHFTPSCDTK